MMGDSFWSVDCALPNYLVCELDNMIVLSQLSQCNVQQDQPQGQPCVIRLSQISTDSKLKKSCLKGLLSRQQKIAQLAAKSMIPYPDEN